MFNALSSNIICELSYDGKLLELQKQIESDPSLAQNKSQDEREPLHWACSGGHDVIVDYLLNTCKVPVDNADDSGWTPLMIASSAGHDNIVAELLRHSADPNKRTVTGQNALHYAASRNRFQIAKMLVHRGIDMNVQDMTTSASPLHRAASKGNLKIVELLLKHDCKVDLKDIEGNTPLHLACEEERVEVTELLLLHGASRTIVNKEEKTPIELAPPYLQRRLEGA